MLLAALSRCRRGTSSPARRSRGTSAAACVFSASASSSSICFLSFSGIVLSAVMSSISFLIAVIGSVKVPDLRIEAAHHHRDVVGDVIELDEAREAMLLGDRLELGLHLGVGLVRSAARRFFWAKSAMSFWAAMKPLIICSLSLTCLNGSSAADAAPAVPISTAMAMAASAERTCPPRPEHFTCLMTSPPRFPWALGPGIERPTRTDRVS